MTTPRFSIVTPVYNTDRRHLEQCIASVLAQTHDDWELCLVDDKSPKKHVRTTLERAAELDPRIRLHFRDENGGIVAASNDGLAMARGELVALLDHDDVLEPDALALVDDVFRSNEQIDYVYTDETLMTEDGHIIEQFHKPGWSPERFRHQMYVCHLSTIRRSLVNEVGGFRSGFDGAQDYDLIFRVTERARKIGHVPKLLYHWRMAASSVANNAAAKPYAYDAGTRAIEAHCKRTGIDANVERLEKFPGNYRLNRRGFESLQVEVFVPNSGITSCVWGQQRDHHVATVESLRHTPGLDVRFTAVEPGASLVSAFNLATFASTADVVVFASEALAPTADGWAAELVRPMTDPSVGITSGVTYTANSRLEHAGYFLHDSFLDRAYFRIGRENRGQRAVLETNYEVSAVDWQCMAVRRELFTELNGFDTRLVHPWVTVDFCLRAHEVGMNALVVPHAEFFEFTNNNDFAWYRTRAPKELHNKWYSSFVSDPYRPRPPLRGSIDSSRPFWQPHSFRQIAKGLIRPMTRG